MNKIKIMLIALCLSPLLLQAQADIEDLEYKLEGIGLVVTRNMNDLQKVIADENLSKQSLQNINKRIAIIRTGLSSLETRIMKLESNDKIKKAFLNLLFPPSMQKEETHENINSKLEIYKPSLDHLGMTINEININDTVSSSYFVNTHILNVRKEATKSSPVIAKLNSGERINILNCNALGWCQLTGKYNGFVAKYLLIKDINE